MESGKSRSKDLQRSGGAAAAAAQHDALFVSCQLTFAGDGYFGLALHMVSDGKIQFLPMQMQCANDGETSEVWLHTMSLEVAKLWDRVLSRGADLSK